MQDKESKWKEAVERKTRKLRLEEKRNNSYENYYYDLYDNPTIINVTPSVTPRVSGFPSSMNCIKHR